MSYGSYVVKVAAIIPSLNPDNEFLSVVKNLVDAGFNQIYIVNDGSSKEYLHFFEEIKQYPQCILLVHERNMGKGYALRTAFSRYLEDSSKYVGVVTLDGDGQHIVEDVIKVASKLEEYPDRLVLGARDFSETQVPTHNALNNVITRKVLKRYCGIPITDTQTGLRGIPNSFIESLVAVKGDRFQYETSMLLETKQKRIDVIEVPISTIYINGNVSSHFRPFRDSIPIYYLILKYAFSSFIRFALSSLISTIFDLTLFLLLSYLLRDHVLGLRLLLATIIARVCSGLLNFYSNKILVFSQKKKEVGSMLRYSTVFLLVMSLSYGGTYLLSSLLNIASIFPKLIIDEALFFLNYHLQRNWVFKSKKEILDN